MAVPAHGKASIFTELNSIGDVLVSNPALVLTSSTRDIQSADLSVTASYKRIVQSIVQTKHIVTGAEDSHFGLAPSTAQRDTLKQLLQYLMVVIFQQNRDRSSFVHKNLQVYN